MSHKTIRAERKERGTVLHNHMFSVCFSVIDVSPHPEEVPLDELIAALLKRAADIASTRDSEAISDEGDSYMEES